jgi:rod shape determining protein RodA
VRLPQSVRIYGRRLDLFLVLPALALILIGILAVYSATEYTGSPRSGFFMRHLLAYPAALVALFVAMTIPLRTLEDFCYPLYAIGIALLVAVLLVGLEVHGARRWLVAGPIRMQPAEVVKTLTVLALAHFLIGKRRDCARMGTLLPAFFLILLPMIFILKEPDLGTSAAFAAIGLCMLIWAGLPMLHLLLMASPLVGLALCRHWVAWGLFVLVGAIIIWKSRATWLILAAFLTVQVALFVAAPLVWERLEPYQKARLTTFLDPEKDPAGAGYQILQSKITIGSGGIWGKGYLQGTQKALAFLPQQHTDFIFGVVGEELGFLGSLVTILLFFALIARGYFLGLHCRNHFGAMVAVGLSSIFLYHAGVNMAMTVGLLPVTGLPLPFLSYGGSFLVSSLAMLGLLLNVSAHRYDY